VEASLERENGNSTQIPEDEASAVAGNGGGRKARQALERDGGLGREAFGEGAQPGSEHDCDRRGVRREAEGSPRRARAGEGQLGPGGHGRRL